MGITIKTSGFDEMRKKLERIQKKSEELNGKKIPFSELFNQSFMNQHSKFSSFSELLEAGGYEVNSKEDFEAIPDDEFNAYISKSTDFDDWESMQHLAMKEYVKRNLF